MEALKTFTLQYLLAGKDFIKKVFLFILMIIFVRLTEILWINNFKLINPNSIPQWFGLGFDVLYSLQIMGCLLLPFLLFYFMNKFFSKTFLIIIIYVLILFNLGLIGYFNTTSILLGSDFFAYSLSDISKIISTTDIPWFGAGIGVITILVVQFLLDSWISGMNIHPRLVNVFFILILISFFIPGLHFNSKSFHKEYDYFLSENKLNFFVKSNFNYLENKARMNQLVSIPVQNINLIENKTIISHPSTFKDYPLLHKDETPDVLSQFFNKSDSTKPSLIFIIVESLGSAYSGPANYLGSFTPFLDSLSKKSLYWKNCVSTAGRTFQVLPAVFGSLPFGETGFSDLKEKMPLHLSLPRLLKNNNYTSSFFYGGENSFDNMDIFLKKQNLDNIIDENSFGTGYKKIPAKDNGFSWGYGDSELFNKYLNFTKNRNEPRIDILLTLSMHDPFINNNPEYYNNLFEQHLINSKLTEKQIEYCHQYKKQFTSVLYFDDALRHLISEFKNRPSFKNSIFIITGDHRMPEIPIQTQIDRFHVPLLIYSPLLNTSKIFEGVSSHLDITPTFIAFLRNSFKLNFPQYCHWLGYELDISTEFRNLHVYPLTRNKNELIDLFSGTNFLSNNETYLINGQFDMEPIPNETLKKQLIENLMYFKQVNWLVCRNNKILPDSIYYKW